MTQHAEMSSKEVTLDKLAIGATARIKRIAPDAPGRKKLADVGIVPGAQVTMQAHAPFGGLLRIALLGTSISIHSDDARLVTCSCN